MPGTSCRLRRNIRRVAETVNQRNQAAVAGRPLILAVAAFLGSTQLGLAQTQPQWPEGTGSRSRLGLVHQADGQRSWAVRSPDQPVQGISFEDGIVRSSWTRAG
jgi:hypothetical protein